MRDDPLLQPFHLKHLVLKNRLMSTAHEPSYAEDGLPTARYREYHAEKARGGIALTMTAGSAIVSSDSPPAFGNLHAYRDEIVPRLSELTEACHEHGCAVMIQLTHLGRRTGPYGGDWLPVVSPSAVRETAHRSFPKALEDWDIERIVADWAAAAARMQAAGLDGIEIEAYGHLLDAFWSPATNRRDDEYGGSFDNRMRFGDRVIEAVREAVGPDFIVGIRMVADEMNAHGISKEEGLRIARRVAVSGHYDFINLIRGSIESDASLTKVIPLAGMALAPHVEFAGEVREATRVPVFHAARIADVATARHAVAAGKLDMVGMTRAHLADPHIVRKIERGEEARIRPCVGATYCLDRIYEGGEALCVHNPATGRERHLPQVVPRTHGPLRRVVVVGAGPGGLEAARVAAERGHEVVVLEAASEPGGQVRLLTRNPRRRDMAGIVDWRVAECERLGVELRCNAYADADDVLALTPDIVVIATGGYAQSPPLEAGEELVTSSWDALSGDAPIAERVLFYDDNGAHAGLTSAEHVARSGASMELVTPERFFAPDTGGMNVVPYLEAFQRSGTRITIATRLRAVHREGNELVATLGSDYAPDLVETRRVDQVIVEHGTAALDELYFELKERSVNRGEIDHAALIARDDDFARLFPGASNGEDERFVLYRVGDAVASRNIHVAVHDALRIGTLW